jgi:hypothetical protein
MRQSRDAEPVGMLRVVWTHNAMDAALRQARLNQAVISLIALFVAVGFLYFVVASPPAARRWR